MRKFISIFLLFLYISGIPQFTEILKIYNLVEHFLEHKQEKSDLSFLTFLKVHYASGDVKDEDYAKDMKLPFKSVTKAEDAHTAIFQNVNTENNLEFLIFEKNITTLFKASRHISLFLSEIWQPPKYFDFI